MADLRLVQGPPEPPRFVLDQLRLEFSAPRSLSDEEGQELHDRLQNLGGILEGIAQDWLAEHMEEVTVRVRE